MSQDSNHASPAPPPSPTAESVESIAERLRETFIDHPFGVIRFWGFSVVRPNDQSWVAVAVHADGVRLEITLVHESRRGSASILLVQAPEGLEASPGGGIVIRRAERLALWDAEAWADPPSYRLRTPRGEGSFEMKDSPALTLSL